MVTAQFAVAVIETVVAAMVTFSLAMMVVELWTAGQGLCSLGRIVPLAVLQQRRLKLAA